MDDEEKPNHIPSIAAVMTPFPWVVGIGQPLRDAKAMMKSHRIRHLPVLDGEDLVGVVSDRDIHLVESTCEELDELAHLNVRDACIRDVYVVDLSTPLDKVLIEMANRHIGSALVTREGKIAGIFTVTDACRRFGEFLRKMFPPPGDDEIA